MAARLAPIFLLLALALDIHAMGALVSLNVLESPLLVSNCIELCSLGALVRRSSGHAPLISLY